MFLPFLPYVGVLVPLQDFVLFVLLCFVELHSLLEDVLQAWKSGDGILAVLVELVHLSVLIHCYFPDVFGIFLFLSFLVKIRLQFIFIFCLLLHLGMSGR